MPQRRWPLACARASRFEARERERKKPERAERPRGRAPTDQRTAAPTEQGERIVGVGAPTTDEIGGARRRPGVVVARPAVFLTLVILSCVAFGAVIYWLLRSMRI